MVNLRFLATSISALAVASAAEAGGYVVPIIEAAPQVVASAGGGTPNVAWLALLALPFLFRDGGGDRATLPPGDHGGPCFKEGTLICTDTGYKPVEELVLGELVTTSRGAQPILSLESWVPTEFDDRPVIFSGVYLSKNHGVRMNQFKVRADAASVRRGKIDGSRYFHILVESHAWLFAKGDQGVIMAESLLLTADMKPLCDRFPQLIEAHASNPCDSITPELV